MPATATAHTAENTACLSHSIVPKSKACRVGVDAPVVLLLHRRTRPRTPRSGPITQHQRSWPSQHQKCNENGWATRTACPMVTPLPPLFAGSIVVVVLVLALRALVLGEAALVRLSAAGLDADRVVGAMSGLQSCSMDVDGWFNRWFRLRLCVGWRERRMST